MLEEFEDNGETAMFAPAEGFYATEGLGRDEIYEEGRIPKKLCKRRLT